MIKKEWFIAAIFTLITILAWVAFDILHTRQQVEIPQQLQELTEPINPEFNTGGL
ncbi:MAG: hypothetical protein AAB414_00940 [Patescibacteria group bacterium]